MAKKKLYYRIGEACKRLDIQPYVLRYWETEFKALSPSKSKSGQRVYGERDLALIGRIKELLYDEGFTIAGAKKRLEAELEQGGPGATAEAEPEEPAAAKSEPPAASSTAGQSLDTAPGEAVETLRQGVRKALEQTREILALLDREA